MGRLSKQMKSEIDALKRGETFVTESPIGDRGEVRPPAGTPNGRILLRITPREHATLVREAAEQGVSLNHYLTEIVCGRRRMIAPSTPRRAMRRGRSSRPAGTRSIARA